MLRINPKKRTETSEEETEQDNFRGGGGWDGHEHYFRVKRQKLRRQFAKDSRVNQDITNSETSVLFSNMFFYIDGRTDPPIDAIQLRDLLYKHGGRVEQYYSSKIVTHVIANQLATAKEKEFLKMKIKAPILIKPQWVLDCIQQSQILSPVNYSCCASSSTADNKKLFAEPLPKQVQQQNYRNAATDPNFIENYFKSSRLHFIGAWKSKVVQYAKQLQATKPNILQNDSNSIHFIIHLDMDCFFANVALISHPELKNEPVAVAHTEENSSEISSCNYIARNFGVKAGMWLKSARELCPNLKILPYNFEKYESIALEVVQILHSHFQTIQVLSIDECMIEAYAKNNEHIQEWVQKVRKEIEEKTGGCTCSAGISHNMLLARIATAKAKPNGQFLIDTFNKEQVQNFLKQITIDQLPLVGRSTKKLLQQHFQPMDTCEHLQTISKSKLQQLLGNKKGELLFQYCRGLDERKLQDSSMEKQLSKKSVGCDVNYGIRFTELAQVNLFLEKLAIELSQRCKTENVMGKYLSLKILKRQEDAPEPAKYNGHGYVDVFTKSFSLDHFTNDASEMASIVKNLFKQFRFEPSDLRGIGMHLSKLTWNEQQETEEKPKYVHTTLSQFFHRTEKSIPVDGAVKGNEEVPKEQSLQDHELVQFEDAIAETLVFQTRRDVSNPILPDSFSQVNHSVFEDLPQNIKAELKNYYSTKSKERIRSGNKKKSSSKQQVTIDLFAKKPNSNSNDVIPSDIDFEVWKELPLDIRRQVLKEWEQVKQKNYFTDSIQKTKQEQIVEINDDPIEDVSDTTFENAKASLKRKFLDREELREEFESFVQTRLMENDIYSIFVLLKWMRRKAEEEQDLRSVWNQLLDKANEKLVKNNVVCTKYWDTVLDLEKLEK